jgi:hypothetical protein
MASKDKIKNRLGEKQMTATDASRLFIQLCLGNYAKANAKIFFINFGAVK